MRKKDTTGKPQENYKPLIQLNGWQTVQTYAKYHKYKSTQYVYELIKTSKVDYLRVKELNNLLLVKDKL